MEHDSNLQAFTHQPTHSRFCFVMLLILISICHGEERYFDTMTLTLQGQNLTEYNCIAIKSQITKSLYLTEQCGKFDEGRGKIVFDADGLFSNAHAGNIVADVLMCPLPYDEDKEFLKMGFKDMCNYLQNNNFNQELQYDEYQLPMPLFLDNPHDFYDHVTQLTDQEIIFLKEIESFDDNHSSINLFDIDMARMDNLFKIAEFLQMKRLLTIIAARQASVMTNMNKSTMIQWLLDNHDTNQMMIGAAADAQDNNQCNNNNNHKNHNNGRGVNPKMVPLLQQTHSSNKCDTITCINDVSKYNWARLTNIIPFFSCYGIHTFSSISNEFYEFATEWWHTNKTIDPMIKILTHNNDSTCLLLTNQEVIFYKPFLTLPQSRWGENQNKTYNQLKTMTNGKINLDVKNEFDFNTLISFDNIYSLHTLKCSINNDDHSLEIRGNIQSQKGFRSISYKFGKFAQQLNVFAQSMNVEHIKIHVYYFEHLTSFNDLIGIYDINNVKTIKICEHSFAFFNFEEIYNINSEIEHLEIETTHKDATKTRYVRNIQYLSKLQSLKGLSLSNNNLDSLDFNAMKTLTNLEVIRVFGNKFNYKSNTECLDFAFLHNIPNLTELHLDNNQIGCVDNFAAIQTPSNLVSLDLARNEISSLDLIAFRGTNLHHIDLSRNKLQVQQCLDFDSFNGIDKLQWLHLEFNQIQCIVNFESIQQHTYLHSLSLDNNQLASSIDFSKFDESKPLMNSLGWMHFSHMNLKYTKHNNNCLDLKFLKFISDVEELDFAYNKIECIDNLSILQQKDVNVEYLYLDNNNLLSFDFADLIGSNIGQIYLTNNSLSMESLKNFDANTLSQINPSAEVMIDITYGNHIDLLRPKATRVSIF